MDLLTRSERAGANRTKQVHLCIIEPGGVQTNFASTSPQKIPLHPAYAAEDTPARVMERYLDDPKSREGWSRSEDMVAAMYKIADGKKIPLRVPLGPDSWGMLVSEYARMQTELEEIKPISLGVGQQGQLENISFLKG
jgi:hypothetical protein